MNAENVGHLLRLQAHYGPRLRAYITAYLGRRDYDAAEGLSQETWVRVSRSLDTLPYGTQPAFGWLAWLARQTVTEYYLRTRRRSVASEVGS